MTKIQNSQQAQTNMKTLLFWEPWNSQGFIPQTQWKVSCSSIKWSCVNNIIMRPNPANAWLYMLRSTCMLLVVVRSVPPATTRRLGRCPGSGGLGLPTATGHRSEPSWQRCSARLETRPRHKKSEGWMLNLPEKVFWGNRHQLCLLLFCRKQLFLTVQFRNIHAQLWNTTCQLPGLKGWLIPKCYCPGCYDLASHSKVTFWPARHCEAFTPEQESTIAWELW